MRLTDWRTRGTGSTLLTVRTATRQLAVRALFFLVFFLAAGHLAAHSFIRPNVPPTSARNSYTVRRPAVSQVYYTPVPGPGSRAWFSFDARQGDVIHFNVGVPFVERLSSLVVRAAMIGPGLSQGVPLSLDYGRLGNAERPEVAALTAEVVALSAENTGAGTGDAGAAAGALDSRRIGAVTFEEGRERRVFHEHFTDTTSWIIVQADVTIPEDGTYYLVTWPVEPLPPESKLWLAIGVKERFTLHDIFRIGHILRTVREFHENPR